MIDVITAQPPRAPVVRSSLNSGHEATAWTCRLTHFGSGQREPQYVAPALLVEIEV